MVSVYRPPSFPYAHCELGEVKYLGLSPGGNANEVDLRLLARYGTPQSTIPFLIKLVGKHCIPFPSNEHCHLSNFRTFTRRHGPAMLRTKFENTSRLEKPERAVCAHQGVRDCHCQSILVRNKNSDMASAGKRACTRSLTSLRFRQPTN